MSILAVDFDGTLVDDAYPAIGKPKAEVFDFCSKARKSGSKVILWTCRCGDLLQQAVHFCALQGLEFDAVNQNVPENVSQYGSDCRKVFADYYIDDKAVDLLDLSRITGGK